MAAVLLGPAVSVAQETLQFSIVDRSGHPVENARVAMYADRPDGELTAASLLEETGTSPSGVASLRTAGGQLPVTIVVSAPGYRLTITTPRDSASVPIVLEAGHDVAFELREGREPVTGRVEWNITPRLKMAAVSDTQGHGVLLGLPSTEMLLTAIARGGRSSQVIQPDTERIIFSLPVSSNLTGRVLDRSGRPIADAVAVLIRGSAVEARTDATGVFQFSGLGRGLHELEVGAGGFRTETISVDIGSAPAVTLPAIVLVPGAQIVARFIDANTGDPIVRPRLVRESNTPMGFSARDIIRPQRPYVGLNDGSIAIGELPVGSHQFVLDTPPFARLRLPPLDISSDSAFIDLGTVLVDRGAVLDLLVLSHGDQPATGMPVRLDHGPALSPLTPASGSTDEQGHVRFERLGPGRYRLRVGGDERPGAGGTTAQHEQWFTVAGTESTISKKVVIDGARLTIRVEADSGPVALAPVSVLAGEDEPAAGVAGYVVQMPGRMINVPFLRGARGESGGDGRVVLDDVPLGPARLTVSLGSSSWSQSMVMGERDEERVVRIPSRAMTIRSRDSFDGRPMSAQVVWETESGIRVSGHAANDDLTLLGIPDGPGILRVTAIGYELYRVEFASPDRVVSDVMLTPSVPTTLVCQVTGTDGFPLRDASLELLQTAQGWSKRYVVTDDEGRASFVDVQPGQARVIVRRAPFASVVSNIIIAKGTNDLGAVRLAAGYRVMLTLDDNERNGAAMFRLVVFNQHGVEVQDGLDDVSPATIGTGGEASIGPLAPGTYRIEAVGQAATLRGEARVRNQAVEVRIR